MLASIINELRVINGARGVLGPGALGTPGARTPWVRNF